MAMAPYSSLGEKVWYYLLRVICGLIFFFLMAPIVAIIPLSFNSIPFFTYPMEGFSWRWYAVLFGDSTQSILWQRAFVNSIIVAVGSTTLATILGTMAAIGMTRANFPFKSALMAILISPIIVPIVIVAIAMFFFYARIGLVGNMFGIIFAHTTLGAPFVVITVTATLQGFDQNMIRAGYILGARPLRVFRKVTLPLILPGVVSGGLFAFAVSWDEVVVVLFLATAEQHTVPRRMWSGIRELLSPTIISAATILIMVSIVLMFTMEWLRRRGERLRGISPN
ncbi:MAG TPA: ABC transporter permease [Arenicellales bacterium]|nr:polyamine ABC transporter permease [Acidiferrobacteraceae bacterium]MDP6136446.1 ABC transporter permease [Arenicellales bacterium]MDP7219120.1 ABC transporter permease [Arenicellales bacterium]HCF72839.1 polyamine ABC transporter permease [Gammaproteobacteria bacterium]HJP10819.1 ABC transporter permease [Arenicellales bacterium]